LDLDLLFPPDIVELKMEPLQTDREALTAGSVPPERAVDKGSRLDGRTK
jgi:hypothetical protein